MGQKPGLSQVGTNWGHQRVERSHGTYPKPSGHRRRLVGRETKVKSVDAVHPSPSLSVLTGSVGNEWSNRINLVPSTCQDLKVMYSGKLNLDLTVYGSLG